MKKISDYREPKVGDLIIYNKNSKDEDVGYVQEINTTHDGFTRLHILWMKTDIQRKTEEILQDIMYDWNEGYVLNIKEL